MSTHDFRAPAARPTRYDTMHSPVGEMLLACDGEALTAVSMLPDAKWFPGIGDTWVRDPGAVAEAARQLEAYFAGELTVFDLPLAPHGTPFQLRVWSALTEIPYGRTATYGDIAREIGRPDAVRAVGAANGRNPISIIVPCHRVIGADGSLTGYGGGLDRKRALLDLESARAEPQPALFGHTSFAAHRPGGADVHSAGLR